MAVREDKNKKDESKGFAGLSSLVSDVDTSTPPAAKKEPSSASGASSSPPPTGSQTAQPQPRQEQTYQEPPQPSSGSSGGKWVLGIAAVIGVLWLIGQSDKSTTSPAPAYSPPAQTATPNYAPPAQPQEPSRPAESQPPVGQSIVLSTAQIRYCLAEDIRMDGAKAAVNNYNDSDVDRFNAMAIDYNSRCGNFRYRSGALESARRDIEPYRNQLQSEGQSRFTRSPSTGALSPQAPSRPMPDTTVQAIQRKLNELGYEAGTADGLMGSGTRSAIIAFRQDRGLAATGVADQALLLQLQRAPVLTSPAESRSATKSLQLSSGESTSLEAACSTDKYVNGPAAYRACVERQKAALAAGVRSPNLSALSSAEQQSIEAACSTDKYVNGPAAYNQCLAGQLAAMSGLGSRRPDLSRLTNSEQQSIEAACSTDKYVNGPAAYNQCLAHQLAAMSGQGSRMPDLSRLTNSERQSIEAACSTDKYVNGPAAYNRCLGTQLAALNQQGGGPDLARFSTADRRSIESACSTDKYVHGPAAYNRCLSKQLVGLR